MFLEAINISCNHLLLVSFAIFYAIATDDTVWKSSQIQCIWPVIQQFTRLCLIMAQVGNSDWENYTTNNFVTCKT